MCLNLWKTYNTFAVKLSGLEAKNRFTNKEAAQKN